MKSMTPLLLHIASLLCFVGAYMEDNIQILIVAQLFFICGVLSSIENKIKGE